MQAIEASSLNSAMSIIYIVTEFSKDLTNAAADRILPIGDQMMKAIDLGAIDRRFVQMLAALGNPARFKMLEILSTQPACVVGDIVELLPLAQATVSQHLKVLQEAGLIYGEQDGATRCCRVAPEALAWLREQTSELEKKLLTPSTEESGETE